MLDRLRLALVPTLVLAGLVSAAMTSAAESAVACGQPAAADITAAFQLAGNGLLPGAYPRAGSGSAPVYVPPSLLMAIGWVESGWRQFTPRGRPLLSFDFGYGIMQITSGMAGAFGNPTGAIDPGVQSDIASDYRYNIAYGARVLAQKWTSTPKIGSGDPTTIEDWYYAIWAYNGWGWVNNPNNPRFTRSGTPASDPASYPYQERVLYFVAHPPRDAAGNPLWRPIHVSLPVRRSIGRNPVSFVPTGTHDEAPSVSGAVYEPASLPTTSAGATLPVKVRVVNTGSAAWLSSGASATLLTYHVFAAGSKPWRSLSPFSPGILSFGQHPSPLLHDVLPGHSITIHTSVSVPSHDGNFLIVWDLERAGGTWFSQLGALPFAEPISVGGPPATPDLTATPATPRPRPEQMYYLADSSVPDGTVVGAGQDIEKGWLIFNAGTVDWGPGWRLVQLSGSSFGRRVIPVPPTMSCHSTNVIATLRAPKGQGRHVAVWRLKDPTGHTFGEKLTVVVVVHGKPPPVTPTPAPTATATPVPSPGPTSTPTPVG